MSTRSQFDRLKWMKAREYLESEAQRKRWSHAYLFVNSSEEKIEENISYIAKVRDCDPSDLIEIEFGEEEGKSGEIKVSEIKKLIHEISLSPLKEVRIAIIRDCERLNQSSGNMLLKALEEPPQKSMFLLFCNDLEQVLPTIRSRCRVVYDYRKVESKESHKYSGLLDLNFAGASKKFDEIVKGEEVEAFLAEITGLYRKRMMESKENNYFRAIYEIDDVKKAIKNNVNPRLALENLYLKLKKIA